MVAISERAMTTTVKDIEHIESQSLNAVSVIKVFFQPGAKIEAGVARVTAINQTLLRIIPPGTAPPGTTPPGTTPPGTTLPLIVQIDAANLPVLQTGVSSKTLSEGELFDYGLNFIRTQLATV